PEKPLPVLMLQLPLDSHWAIASQLTPESALAAVAGPSSDAAPAAPATAMPSPMRPVIRCAVVCRRWRAWYRLCAMTKPRRVRGELSGSGRGCPAAVRAASPRGTRPASGTEELWVPRSCRVDDVQRPAAGLGVTDRGARGADLAEGNHDRGALPND